MRTYRQARRSYIVGGVSALVLTAVAFAVVTFDLLARAATLWVVAVLALVQIAVHFRFFLHVGLRRSHRDDLQLILFTALIIMLMVGGTVWILGDQSARM